LCSISGGNPDDRTTLTVYGPLGIAKFLHSSLELSDSHLAFKLIIHEFVPAFTKKEDLIKIETDFLVSDHIFYDEKNSCFPCEKAGVPGVLVRAAPILHRVYTVGYVLQEESKIGKLDVEKLKSEGVKPGPILSQIKAKKDVTLENGKQLFWKDYIGEDIIGRKVVILGDTYDPTGIAKIAMDCDAITHESTLDDDDKLCIEKGHSTPSMAATFAKKINAKKLILTHYSARYAPEKVEEGDERVSISLLRDQAKKIVDNVELAEDFKVFEIRKEKDVKL
jgi:ribonuclease Z